MAAISFQQLTKSFGPAGGDAAVEDVTLDVEEGQFLVLLGPSGCGKTTLMRMVNRLIEPTSGEIYVNGQEIRQVPVTELRRHIGYVIQQTGLFPHMTVAQNIAVVPRLLGWDRRRIEVRIDELLELVALPAGEYRRRYPRQLSGGQQQRVGIARALAADAPILLMDEPFGAIDAITRTDLQDALLAIQGRVGKTVVFVTHDVEEALRLADRIAVMQSGRVIQYDTPYHLLTQPADDFVRSLLGSDDIFRRLSLVPVERVMEPGNGDDSGSPRIGRDRDARAALSLIIARGARSAVVVDSAGTPVGRLTLERLLDEGAHARPEA